MRHYLMDLDEIKEPFWFRANGFLKEYLENLILSEQPYVVRNLVLEQPDRETRNLLKTCRYFTSILEGRVPNEDIQFGHEFYEKYWRLSDLVDELNASELLNHMDVPFSSNVQDAPWDMIPIKRHYIKELEVRSRYKARADMLLKECLENLVLCEQPYVAEGLMIRNPDDETKVLLLACKYFTSIMLDEKPMRCPDDLMLVDYQHRWRLSDLVNNSKYHMCFSLQDDLNLTKEKSVMK